MFQNNDKSLNLLRKIVNVVIFVAMCVCVIAGIVLIAISFSVSEFNGLIVDFITLITGVCTLILGPILCQIIWLCFDLFFNTILDLKLIRNAQCKEENNLQNIPAPLFKKEVKTDNDSFNVYKKLKDYRILVDENVITEDEYAQIKNNLMSTKANSDSMINKAKELKKLADQKIITEEEFATEKSKMLKK